MKNIILLIISTLAFAIAAIGQTALTTNTLKKDSDAKVEKATVSDIEWITGNWAGKGLGGNVTENWTRTGGDRLIGTFSLVKDGKPVFFEFMQLLVEKENLVLRIKHFNPDMVGWEEKDKTVDFKFIKKDKNRVYFSGLTFEKIGKKKLNIYIAFRQKDKPYTEEVFRFKRSK